MGKIKEAYLIIDYYDIPSHFTIKEGEKFLTSAKNKYELIKSTAIILDVNSDSENHQFKRIRLESKLDKDEFYDVNKILKSMVKIYNEIGKKKL